MTALKFVSRSFILTTIFFQLISSQTCYSNQVANEIRSPQLDNTEMLCKDLASAIQNVIVDKMRRSVCKGPVFGQTLSSYIKDLPNPATTCPICNNKCANSLSTVLGIPISPNSYAVGQKTSAVSTNAVINKPISPNTVTSAPASPNFMISSSVSPNMGISAAVSPNTFVYNAPVSLSTLSQGASVSRNGALTEKVGFSPLRTNVSPYSVQDFNAIGNTISNNIMSRSVPTSGVKNYELLIIKRVPSGYANLV